MVTKKKVCSFVCAALMLTALALQFVPYWSFATEEGEMSCSINSFVWMPREHENMTAYLQEQIEPGYTVDRVWQMPALMLVSGAVGIAFALIKPETVLGGLCACICGGAGLWGFLTNAALKTGQIWAAELIVSALVLAAGAAAISMQTRR